ncbi:hypothetical protein G3435_08225 [Pseudomonas sp. MAFF212428]|uniref:DUF6531 domain-containing protein n=1 Tax=Pseudomonas brassicae TaxID=2708063 RepID=A0A6M0CR07_9PSED|nr:hypothetical protein [Pseudomonas brassicae]
MKTMLTAAAIRCCLPISLSFYSIVTVAAEIPSLDELMPSKERVQRQITVDRVDPHSGNLTIKHTDLSLPGAGGLDISIHRVYDLHRLSAGLQGSYKQSYEWTALGPGWTLSAAPKIYQQNTYAISDVGPYSMYYANPTLDMCKGTNHNVTRFAPSLRLRLADGTDMSLYSVAAPRPEPRTIGACSAKP